MDENFRPYLSGERFSDALEFSVTPAGPVKPRIDQIIDLVRGKRVIHVGCCDHKEILEERLAQNMWLHAIVTEHSEACLGVDINKEAIEVAKKASGLDNIIYGDVSQGGIAEIHDNQWDIALFADVLEHIPNATNFLSGFVSNYKSNVGSVIISVPNSMRAGNFVSGMKSKENINTDHKCEYSPFTICKTMSTSGMVVEDVYFSVFNNETGLRAWVFRKFPYFSHTILVSASLPK